VLLSGGTLGAKDDDVYRNLSPARPKEEMGGDVNQDQYDGHKNSQVPRGTRNAGLAGSQKDRQ
jgi:hypothetical protein